MPASLGTPTHITGTFESAVRHRVDGSGASPARPNTLCPNHAPTMWALGCNSCNDARGWGDTGHLVREGWLDSLFTLKLSLPGFSLLLATTFQVTSCCEEGYDRDSFLMLILFLCSLNSSQRQREMIRVSEENRTLLVRLQKVQPHYRANDWVNQYTHTHTHTHTHAHTHTHTHTHTHSHTHTRTHTHYMYGIGCYKFIQNHRLSILCFHILYTNSVTCTV